MSNPARVAAVIGANRGLGRSSTTTGICLPAAASNSANFGTSAGQIGAADTKPPPGTATTSAEERGDAAPRCPADAPQRAIGASSTSPATRARSARWPTRTNVSYRVSKAGLNSLTRILAAELNGTGILVNAASPGRMNTRTAFGHTDRAPEQGADTPIWLAPLPDDGPAGGLFYERRPLDW